MDASKASRKQTIVKSLCEGRGREKVHGNGTVKSILPGGGKEFEFGRGQPQKYPVLLQGVFVNTTESSIKCYFDVSSFCVLTGNCSAQRFTVLYCFVDM